jgi:hypothetical protein
MEVGADHIMRRGIGARDGAEDLRIHAPFPSATCTTGSFPTAVIPDAPNRCCGHRGAGRPRLQPGHGQSGIANLRCQSLGRSLADAATDHALFTAKQGAAEESAGAEDHRRSVDRGTIGQVQAGDVSALLNQRSRLALHQSQIALLSQQLLHRRLEALAVGLHARALHGAALAAVEHAVMDRASIGGAGDDAVKGIDLTHQMALAQTADSRVAAHGANGVEIETDQRHLRAHARGNGSGLDPCMASADHNHIEILHGPALHEAGAQVKRRVSRGTSFADAEASEQRVEHILGGGPAQKPVERHAGKTQPLPTSSGSSCRASAS